MLARHSLSWIVLAVAVFLSPSANAATIDVGSGGAPDCTFWCVDRYQQVYVSSIFAGPVAIDAVSFFAAPDNGGPTWNGVSTWQMTLSTSLNPVGALDPVFNNNVGGDAAVFDTRTFTGTQSVNDLITFDGAGSFLYDPGNGDLLIDIVRISGSAQGVGLDRGTDPSLMDRAYAFSSTTTADGWNQGFGNRTRFTVVPEPSTAVLLGLGLAGIAARRRMGIASRWTRGGIAVLAGVALVVLASPRPARAAIESRAILKTYFQTGDVPTQDQFASLIDSAVNIVDDRYLLGLKVYDPLSAYSPGDSVVFNRLSVGDRVGEIAEGSAGGPPGLEFAHWDPLDPNDPIHVDVATDFAGRSGYLGIQLLDGFGQVNYGFLQLSMEPLGSALHPAIRVDYLVYESTPNTPITVSAVPEPGTALLLGLGLAGLGVRPLCGSRGRGLHRNRD